MFTLVPPDHPRRAETEDAIRAAFRREHDARLAGFPRTLVAQIDERGVVCAAALRFAEDGFFSERYLEGPVEETVSRHSGVRAERDTLAEVGSLASARPGQVWSLVGGVIHHLHGLGIRWAVFTATARLRTLLRWSGVPLIELAAADPSRVEDPDDWGGYYHHDPRVMAVGEHMVGPLLAPRSSSQRRLGHA